MVNHSPKTDTFGCLIPDDQVERSDVESLKQRVAELELLLKDRLAMPTYQIAGKRPDKCDGCFAPLSGDVCEYCGREAKVEPALPDEPHDIRKTNASDDPCPMCQRVHTKNAYEPIVCRCQKCGNLGIVALSTYDPILGHGIVCRACCGQATPANVQQMEAEAMARQGLTTKMPWQ